MNTHSSSSTTEAALDGITDPAKFESIVTAVLRIARPEYRSFVHLGINASRKTVRAALDGAAFESRDGVVRVVLLAHTTTEKDGLRTKWLATGAQRQPSVRSRRGVQVETRVGDLPKAARVAADVRRRVPSATVTVLLTTNRTPDLDLWLDIVAFGVAQEIQVEVIDRSMIAHVLDYTSEGTAVRRRELGIESDRLSRDVLQHIGRTSTSAYAAEHSLTRPGEWVGRAVSRELDHALSERANLVGLVGESGYGKSALALHALETILDRSGFALWVPAHLLETSSTAVGLLEASLRHWRGALEADAGLKTLALVDEPIVLFVDDAMRTSDPVRALRRLFAIAQPAPMSGFSTGGDAASIISRSHITVVVPAWPSVWATLGQERLKAGGVATVSVGHYLSPEASSALKRGLEVRGFSLSARVITEVAVRLARDPFLTAIFLEGLRSGGEHEVLAVAEGSTERFLLSCLEELAASGRGDCPVAEYLDALTRLAEKCLHAGKLEPDWSLVRYWFCDDSLALRALTQVITQGQICRTSAPPHGQITFRHDRVRDALLSNVIADGIAQAQPPEYVGDPFLSVQVGTALRRAQPNAATLELLFERSPTALAEALKQSWGDAFPARDLIVSSLTKWVEERFETGQSQGLADVDYALLDVLSRTADPSVMGIVAAWPGRLIRWVRFAHGSLMDGILACGPGDLEFTHQYPWRDQIVSAAVERHRPELVSELRKVLAADEFPDDERVNAIIVAGFIRTPELGSEIVSAWARLDSDLRATTAAIWALLYSAPADLESCLQPILKSWEGLPSEVPEGEHFSPQFYVEEELRFSLRDDIPPTSLIVLREKALSSGDFALHLARVVSEVDSPDALSIVVHAAAIVERSIRGTNSYNMFLSQFVDRWNPKHGSWGRALSPESREYLREIWDSESNDTETRHTALKLWLASAQPDEAPLLRGFPEGSKPHRTALWARCRLGDSSALPEALPFLDTEPHWIEVLPPLWCPELRVVVERLLDTQSETESEGQDGASTKFPPWLLARFLVEIPCTAAGELLTANWKKLGKIEDYIKVALALATPETLALVKQSVRDGMEPRKFLTHIGWTLGTRFHPADARITVAVLRGLEPYLDFLPTKELDDLAEYCRRHGYTEWAVKHLLPSVCPETRKAA